MLNRALSPAPTFALIGHQESWDRIAAVVHGFRGPDRAPLTLDTVRELVPWIPPRTVSRLVIRGVRGELMRGVYIETFITPDELARSARRAMLVKIQDAARAAEREGVRVAALGGFTSIVLADDAARLSSRIACTTGNSLTAALIVRGIVHAASRLGIPLADATLLIIGASGDIGSACARYFARDVAQLLLLARNRPRLAALASELGAARRRVLAATDLHVAVAQADIIIAAASLPAPAFDLQAARPGTLICDAGYPKNLRALPAATDVRIFWGGMAHVSGGFWSDDGVLEQFYRFPVPHVGHGCMLEGALLGLAGRFEPFSHGRGNITPGRLREIWQLAEAHGFALAPLFNADGLWRDTEPATVRRGPA